MWKNYKLKFYRFWNKSACTPISSEERSLMIIVSQLLQNKETELLMVPKMDKFYIKSDDSSIFIVIDNISSEAYAINHVFGYHIKMSDRVMNFVLDKFIEEVEKRRTDMEKEYRNNIQYSLNSVVNKFFNNNKNNK
jgi:hypothetical protein